MKARLAKQLTKNEILQAIYRIRQCDACLHGYWYNEKKCRNKYCPRPETLEIDVYELLIFLKPIKERKKFVATVPILIEGSPCIVCNSTKRFSNRKSQMTCSIACAFRANRATFTPNRGTQYSVTHKEALKYEKEYYKNRNVVNPRDLL